MGRELSIVFVSNATKRQADAIVAYNVKMANVQDSKAIRRKFGSYFLGGKDKRPDALKPYSIKNRITAETKIRISVLKLLAKRYRDSNQGSMVKVIGYEPRPLIKITPPSSASDRRVKVFNYVEAVQNLPTNFTSAEVTPIINRINPKLVGQIKSLFIVLSDDQYRPRGPRDAPKADATASGPVQSVSGATRSGSGPTSSSSESSEVMDTTPVAPPPAVTFSAGRRSQKRGASTALTRSAKK